MQSTHIVQCKLSRQRQTDHTLRVLATLVVSPWVPRDSSAYDLFHQLYRHVGAYLVYHEHINGSRYNSSTYAVELYLRLCRPASRRTTIRDIEDPKVISVNVDPSSSHLAADLGLQHASAFLSLRQNVIEAMPGIEVEDVYLVSVVFQQPTSEGSGWEICGRVPMAFPLVPWLDLTPETLQHIAQSGGITLEYTDLISMLRCRGSTFQIGWLDRTPAQLQHYMERERFR